MRAPHTARRNRARFFVAISLAMTMLLLVFSGDRAGGQPASSRPQGMKRSGARDVGGERRQGKWVEETLKSLSLRQRVAQLVIPVAPSEYMNFEGERFAEVRRQIVEDGVGGFIIRGGTPNEVASLTNEMQRLARVPLLIAADYERGLRMQMRNGTPFTTSMGVAAAGDPRAAYAQGRVIAEEMRAIGVNWLFAPVADINNNPDNPVISIRSFGEDPARVAAFVSEAVRGVRDGGALSTLKHFPGHGDTATDSHIGLATIRADRARIDRIELVPFRAGIRAGTDAVMTAHVALPEMTGDDLPATLSPQLTTALLRRELGFDGIIVTDSLSMGAITKGYPKAEGAVRAVKAGADVALTPPDPRAAIDAIVDAVGRGEITAARIDDSVRRLLRAKHRLGLAKNRLVDTGAVNRVIERPENMREAQKVAESSMTLLRNEANLLPLDAGRVERSLFIVVAADDDPEEGRTFIPHIAQRVPRARILRADPRTTPGEYDALLAEAARFEAVVVAVFVKRAASKGTVALPDRQADFVRRLSGGGKPCVIISFGSPYLIRQFPSVTAYMAAYAIEDVAQAAAVRALFGEVAIGGRLPVRVPGLFEIGAGLQTAAQKAGARATMR